MQIRTRFSPSPTGRMHLGNARAALYAAMFAKSNEGVFILRIEDTDVLRSDEAYVEAIENDLHWLDVDWQEGPGKDGKYGPYWQSQRQSFYQRYYAELEKNHLVYPCFCSDKELNIARKLQLSRGKAPRYAGTCRHLSSEDVAAKMAEGIKPAWRFVVPAGIKIEFDDVVKGPQSFSSDDIGDFVIRRADGTAPFLFCNAIDDALMQVSHVLRGEDHVANTPRQLMILDALGLHTPKYGHLSLIMGDDGSPLSKRHGSSSVQDLQNEGYLALAVINYLARLGHIVDVQDLLPFDQLAKYFSLDRLSKSPAKFDTQQLYFWQKQAVQALDGNSMKYWLGESIANIVPDDQYDLFVSVIRPNIAFPAEALMWANIFYQSEIVIEEADKGYLHDAGEQYFVEAEQAVDQYGTDLKSVIAEIKSKLNINGKKLFMPLRLALTGKSYGPELKDVADILGKDKIKQRLGNAFRLAVNE